MRSPRVTLCLAACLLGLSAVGQPLPPETTVRSSSRIWLGLHYGAGLTAGTLSRRFGPHFTVGGELSMLTDKNYFIGFRYEQLFGSTVREDVLSNLRTVEGGIIGRDMQFAELFMRLRGQTMHLQAGKAWPMASSSANTRGLLTTAGVGILIHRIRFVDDFDTAIQIFSPYDRGYDRLTAGWSFSPYIGYYHLSGDQMLNFHAGIRTVVGLTADQRGYAYNTQSVVNQQRTDILCTLIVGWIIPLSRQTGRRYYQ